jgi:hypothetical protein
MAHLLPIIWNFERIWNNWTPTHSMATWFFIWSTICPKTWEMAFQVQISRFIWHQLKHNTVEPTFLFRILHISQLNFLAKTLWITVMIQIVLLSLKHMYVCIPIITLLPWTWSISTHESSRLSVVVNSAKYVGEGEYDSGSSSTHRDVKEKWRRR